jgi:hypothetical protein
MTAAMFVPLTVGARLGDPAAGLLVGVGALLVASADAGGSCSRTATTMSAVAVGCATTNRPRSPGEPGGAAPPAMGAAWQV